MRIKFIGAKYHPLVHKVSLDINQEAEVENDFGLGLITRHPAEWEEVKSDIKSKPAKVVKKKTAKKTATKKK